MLNSVQSKKYDSEIKRAIDREKYKELKEKFIKELNSHKLDKSKVLTLIKESTITNDILRRISEEQNNKLHFSKTEYIKTLSNCSKTLTQLVIRIESGSEFIDYIKDTDKMLICDIAFMNQRQITKPVQCVEAPQFNQVLVFDLIEDVFNSPLHVAVIEVDEVKSKRVLLGTERIDWKLTLCNKTIGKEIILLSKSQVIGKLTIELKIKRGTGFTFLNEDQLFRQIVVEDSYKAINGHFDEYAKKWYEEYIGINEYCKKRYIPISVTSDSQYSMI